LGLIFKYILAVSRDGVGVLVVR